MSDTLEATLPKRGLLWRHILKPAGVGAIMATFFGMEDGLLLHQERSWAEHADFILRTAALWAVTFPVGVVLWHLASRASGDTVREEPPPRRAPPRPWIGAGAIGGLVAGAIVGAAITLVRHPSVIWPEHAGNILGLALLWSAVGAFSGCLMKSIREEQDARRRHPDK